MTATVTTTPAFSVGAPTALFWMGGGGLHWYDVAENGRFLLMKAQGPGRFSAPIRIVLNWTELLKR